MWTPPSWQAGNWAASNWQRANEFVEEEPYSGGSTGGGGFVSSSVDMLLAEEFEQISRESTVLKGQPAQIQPKPLADAIAKTLAATEAEQQARAAEIVRQVELRAAALAKLKESEALAAKAIEDARQSAIDGYNALMLALVMLDED